MSNIKSLTRKILPRALWTQLRLVRIQLGIKLFRPRIVSHTFGKCRLQVLLADPLAAGWYDHDWPALPELVLLQRGRLKPGARVFDIGAHQCVVAMMLADIVGDQGLVVALEPNPHNAAVGEKNKKLNGTERLRIVQGAVAEKSGTIAMNQTLDAQVDDGSHEWGSLQVASFSIDDLSRQHGHPDVLFIDVEGYECHALRGAACTLRSGPDCFVEVHVGAGLEKFGSVEEVVSFFPREEYSLFVRTEAQESFREFFPRDEVPGERFFLVALSRSAKT